MHGCAWSWRRPAAFCYCDENDDDDDDDDNTDDHADKTARTMPTV
jgi:hypothetical protein